MSRLLLNSGYVAVGAALGGVLRYVATVWIQGRAGPGFPVATLAINVSGSLLLGFLMGYFAETTFLSPEVRLFWGTGLCGGYTTFSTFSYETVVLIRDGAYGRSATYVGASLVLSVAAVFAGFVAARGAIHLQRGGV